MSAVIKAGTARPVRSLDLRSIAGGPAPLAEVPIIRSPAELALDEARDQIARLKALLAALDEKQRGEREEAYANGFKAGVESADDGAEQRLERVHEAGDAALDIWRGRMTELDMVAAALAGRAVAKLFSPHADLSDLVNRAITAKIARLRAESVVAVRVSGEDFADPSAVAASTDGIEIILDPRLKSGACHIDLRLGEVDLTIDGLAQEVDAFFQSLDEMA